MTLVKATAHIQLLRRYQPLLRELVTQDLKIKYRRSFLGYIWSLLNPLLILSAITRRRSKNYAPNPSGWITAMSWRLGTLRKCSSCTKTHTAVEERILGTL